MSKVARDEQAGEGPGTRNKIFSFSPARFVRRRLCSCHQRSGLVFSKVNFSKICLGSVNSSFIKLVISCLT